MPGTPDNFNLARQRRIHAAQLQRERDRKLEQERCRHAFLWTLDGEQRCQKCGLMPYPWKEQSCTS